MAHSETQLNVRMRETLKEKIERFAAKYGMKATTWVRGYLERSFDEGDDFPLPPKAFGGMHPPKRNPRKPAA